MGLSLGNKNIGSIYKGDKSIGKIYLGNKLIFQKSLPFPVLGLQHYWNLNETSGIIGYDSFNNKNLTFNKTGVLNNVGKNNKGIFADGNNNSFGSTTTLNQNFLLPYNISFWFKVDSLSNLGISRLIDIGEPTSSIYHGMVIYLNGSTFNIQFGNGIGVNASARRSFTLNNAFVKDQWYHVSLNVVSLYNITLYINGINSNIPYNSGNATSVDYGDNRFSLFKNYIFGETDNVYIDEVGIWSKNLTLEEVQILYNNGRGSFYK